MIVAFWTSFWDAWNAKIVAFICYEGNQMFDLFLSINGWEGFEFWNGSQPTHLLSKKKKEKLSPQNMISFESFLSTYCCFSWSFILSSLYYMCVLIYLNQWEQRHNNPWVKMEHLMIESITDCLYVNCIISKKTATKDHNKTSHITHINCKYSLVHIW